MAKLKQSSVDTVHYKGIYGAEGFEGEAFSIGGDATGDLHCPGMDGMKGLLQQISPKLNI